VVCYAPQAALLSRARLFITHAGLNSALESLVHGVPMVAIPVTNDQPGVAARLQRAGVAEVLPMGQLTEARLRHLVQRALANQALHDAAKRCSEAIRARDGLQLAAQIVERALATRRPVLRDG
jgi:UDP:flavonoid glycosyltransferase YjiC (YdhE family)